MKKIGSVLNKVDIFEEFALTGDSRLIKRYAQANNPNFNKAFQDANEELYEIKGLTQISPKDKLLRLKALESSCSLKLEPLLSNIAQENQYLDFQKRLDDEKNKILSQDPKLLSVLNFADQKKINNQLNNPNIIHETPFNSNNLDLTPTELGLLRLAPPPKKSNYNRSNLKKFAGLTKEEVINHINGALNRLISEVKYDSNIKSKLQSLFLTQDANEKQIQRSFAEALKISANEGVKNQDNPAFGVIQNYLSSVRNDVVNIDTVSDIRDSLRQPEQPKTLESDVRVVDVKDLPLVQEDKFKKLFSQANISLYQIMGQPNGKAKFLKLRELDSKYSSQLEALLSGLSSMQRNQYKDYKKRLDGEVRKMLTMDPDLLKVLDYTRPTSGGTLTREDQGMLELTDRDKQLNQLSPQDAPSNPFPR